MPKLPPYDQVEFDAVRPVTGLIYHQVIDIPDGQIQNLRVKNFTDPSVAGADDFVIAYGDDSSTNIREYRVTTSGGTTTVTPVEFSPGVFVLTDSTTVVFDNITATSDGRIVITYDRLVNALPDQTSQYEFKTFDLRTTGVTIDGNASPSGHDRYVAGLSSPTRSSAKTTSTTHIIISAPISPAPGRRRRMSSMAEPAAGIRRFSPTISKLSISGFVITNIGDPAITAR